MHLKAFLFFLLFLSTVNSGAQSSQKLIDSLKLVLSAARVDSTRAMHLCELGNAFYKTNTDSALVYLTKGLALAEATHYKKAEAQCCLNLGIVYWAKGDYNASLDFYNLAVKGFENTGDTNSQIKALINLGYSNYSIGEFDKALSHYLAAKELVNLEKDTLMYAGILHNVGLVYQQRGRHVQALEHYRESLSLKQQSADEQARAYQVSTLGAIGGIYQFMKDYHRAREYYLKALDISRELDNKIGVIVFTYNLGVNHQKEENFESAKSLIYKALEEAQSYGNPTYVAYCYNSLGEISMEVGEYEKAAKLLIEALNIRRKLADKNALTESLASSAELAALLNEDRKLSAYLDEFFSLQKYANLEDQKACALLQSKLKQKKGNYKESIEFFKMANSLGDSLSNIEKEGELERLKIEFDSEINQKSQQVELMTKDRAIAALKTKNQYISIVGLILALLIVSGLAIALFRSSQKRRQTHQQLAINNEKLSQSKYQLERANIQFGKVNQDLEMANNSLQQFAFAASHDLKESLRSVTSFSQLLRQNVEAGTADNQLDKYVDYIVDGSRRMRKTLDDLLQYSDIPAENTAAEILNLSQLIRSLELQMVNNGQLPQDHYLKLTAFPPIFAEKKLVKQLIFNLLDNAGKYRHEDRILNISFGMAPNKEKTNVFYCKDNGVGIEPAYLTYIFEPFRRLDNRTKHGAGLGLAVAKKIVKKYGGEIWAESQLHQGVTIYFTLPNAFPPHNIEN